MHILKSLCLSLGLIGFTAVAVAQESESVSFENTYYVGVKSTLANKLGKAFREFNKGGNAELADVLSGNENIQEFRLKISITGTHLESKISSLLKEVMVANPYLKDLPKTELLQIRSGLLQAHISPPELISKDAYLGSVLAPSPLGRRFVRILVPRGVQEHSSLSFGEVMILEDNTILRAEIILTNAKIANLDQQPLDLKISKKVKMSDLVAPAASVVLNVSQARLVFAQTIAPQQTASAQYMIERFFGAGHIDGDEYNFPDTKILSGRFVVSGGTGLLDHALLQDDEPHPEYPRLKETGGLSALRLASLKTHDAFCSLYVKGEIIVRKGFNPIQPGRKYDPYLGVQAQCINK